MIGRTLEMYSQVRTTFFIDLCTGDQRKAVTQYKVMKRNKKCEKTFIFADSIIFK